MDLVKYDAACKALAAAKSVDEVKLIRDKAQAIAAAARIAKNHGLEIDAAEIRIRAERRLGEMIAEQKATVGLNPGGRPTKTPTTKVGVSPSLEQAGIDWKLSSRSQAIAAIPEASFEATLSEHREAQQAVTAKTLETLARKGSVHVSHNSGENEWYTPKEYIEAAREAMGSIDTDPASCEQANKTVGATQFFDEDANGLEQTWNGNVWMNPPYAQPQIRQFSEAVAEKFQKGEIEQAIVLVNNATETEWFGIMAEQAAAICFPSGRIRFIDKDGKPSGAPLQGQAVLYMGRNAARFKKAFAGFGWIAEVCRD
jgi:phage N-6-adenine-methyltransferase